MRKRVCILTTAHPIDDVRVYHKIALSLVKEFEVIWIGPDIYFFENILSNDGISRKLFKNKKGIIGRLHNNIKLFKIFLIERKNMQYAYFPDPDLALIFTFFIRSKSVKKIFDIHEVYHKELLNRRIKGFLYPIFKNFVIKIIKNIVSKVDLTIGVSKTVLNYYVLSKTPHLIIRSCLPQDFSKLNDQNGVKKKIFTVIHGKNHMSRGTLQVLNALKILKEKKINCKVLMIDQEDTGNVIFHSFVKTYDIGSNIDLYKGLPFKEMIYQMGMCHAGLIAYGNELGVDSLPNRFFEYMALGLPVIVPSCSQEMVDIVEKEKCGIIVDTQDSMKIAKCIEFLMSNPESSNKMGKRGKNAFLERHNWENEVKPLINYIKLN
jgi:glycosyltransferase involved in cell wall biosynthesis